MWTHRPAIYSPHHRRLGPSLRPAQTPHCSLAKLKPPKTSRQPASLDDRCVDTGQVMGGPRRATIVSRKMLSADDPACTVAVVQSHPYESGSDLRTPSSAAARRTVHCTDTFCRAERAHRGERGGGGEQRVHFALQQCVLGLATTRHRADKAFAGIVANIDEKLRQ